MAKTKMVGGINISKIAHLNKHLSIPKNKEVKMKVSISAIKKPSKEKDWINKCLWANSLVNAIPFTTEYQFHPVRKWRFDWCFPSIKLAIEYNGIMSEKSRHTTITGYTKDMDKLNAAQQLGWIVLQYTPLNYKNLPNDFEEILKQKEV